MALSDCDMCWETPCSCGHEYKKWSTDKLNNLHQIIESELETRSKKFPIKGKIPKFPSTLFKTLLEIDTFWVMIIGSIVLSLITISVASLFDITLNFGILLLTFSVLILSEFIDDLRKNKKDKE